MLKNRVSEHIFPLVSHLRKVPRIDFNPQISYWTNALYGGRSLFLRHYDSAGSDARSRYLVKLDPLRKALTEAKGGQGWFIMHDQRMVLRQVAPQRQGHLFENGFRVHGRTHRMTFVPGLATRLTARPVTPLPAWCRNGHPS